MKEHWKPGENPSCGAAGPSRENFPWKLPGDKQSQGFCKLLARREPCVASSASPSRVCQGEAGCTRADPGGTPVTLTARYAISDRLQCLKDL